MIDNVKRPAHYQIIDNIESIDVIARSMTVIASTMTTEQFKGFCYGNAIRCTLRLSEEDDVKKDIEEAKQFKLFFENKKHLCISLE